MTIETLNIKSMNAITCIYYIFPHHCIIQVNNVISFLTFYELLYLYNVQILVIKESETKIISQNIPRRKSMFKVINEKTLLSNVYVWYT